MYETHRVVEDEGHWCVFSFGQGMFVKEIESALCRFHFIRGLHAAHHNQSRSIVSRSLANRLGIPTKVQKTHESVA